jgi:hypothetical protein
MIVPAAAGAFCGSCLSGARQSFFLDHQGVFGMTSERRKEANRRNALKSTGPRTTEGKAAVALNGMKHGLLSRETLVQGELEADLVDFGKRLRAQLAPVGELELLLADRIVSCGWRLRRLLRVESRLFKEDGAQLEQAFSNYGREKMAVLSRYEATIDRSLFKALHELQRLQATRWGKTVPLPEAVDVEVAFTAQEELGAVALLRKRTGFPAVEIESEAEPAEAEGMREL